MMNKWRLSAIPFLERRNYQEVINIYENKLEDNPDNIDDLWYLGLAYLLGEREEEAQSIWLMAFLEIDEEYHDYWQENLLAVLDTEANKQKAENAFHLSYIIRENIRSIQPQKINNLLELILLKIELKIFTINDIEEWNLNTLIKESGRDEIDSNLLFLITEQILHFPFDKILNFAQTVFNYFEGSDKIVQLFLSQARKIGQEQHCYINAGKLAEICLQNQPNNLDILNQVLSYFSLAQNDDRVKMLSERFYQFSKTLPEKAFGLRLLISNTITLGNWQEAKIMVDQYKKVLTELVHKKPDIQESFIRNSLSMISQALLYFDDQPKEKRFIINGVARLFQQLIRKNYSCPVHFISPEQKITSRKLKIGYIGNTLRSHSVGLLSRWLVSHHNPDEFSIHTYFVCNQPEDEITQRFFREKVERAYNSNNVINDLVTQIEKDEIDILVDLDSFTHNMTSIIMALKPAPIQVSWLGMDTNGIPSIDYFLVDNYVLPKNAQEYYQEKLWRLTNSYVCVDGFEVDVATITRKDLQIPENSVIYFNTQNALKRHPDTIHLQMKVLAEVPNSYLVIKGNGDQTILQQLFISIAEQEGIAPSRLKFLPRSATEAIHRANLQIADVVFDTYPYNGATTTLETLWMEIPLVTRVGEQFAARNSYTFMTNAGITEGIAWSDEEYIEWGIKLGKDENLRREISWKLRQSKKTSPLWNGKQFAKEVEKAYRQMWEIYLREKES